MKANLKIIAIASQDGWAFVQEDTRIVLLKPPYNYLDMVHVTRATVQKAIDIHGFEKCDVNKEFNNIGEIIQYIKRDYVQFKKTQGIDMPTPEELKGLLNYANDDVLISYLNKARNELIPLGKIIAAKSIASDLKELDRIVENPEICRLIEEILELCKSEMRNFEETKAEWTHKYPNISGKYDMASIICLQRATSQRGQLLRIVG